MEKQKIVTNEKENTAKSVGCSKSGTKKDVYSNIGLPQETRRISNKQYKLTRKWTRKRRQTKPKSLEGRNSKNQSRNKWNREKEENRKDRWNCKLVLLRDKQN